jgi:hypothetical protein
MKKLYMVLSLAGAMAAPNVFASMTVVLTQNTSQYSAGDGGEFRATGGGNPTLNSIVNWNAYNTGAAANTAGSGDAYFQTFCIQTTVYFYPGTTYNAAPGDSITIGTAWLYSQFAAGTLSGYNYAYGGNRVNTAGSLQQAIWWLQGQTGGVNNSFVTLAETTLGLNDTTIKLDGNGAYGVDSLNLTDVNGNAAAQDQLVIVVPETTTVIAGMLLLLPLGASTLRILRKTRTA